MRCTEATARSPAPRVSCWRAAFRRCFIASRAGAAIGGGDVKLFAALGALLGPTVGLQLELLAFGLLTVFALVRLAFLGRLFSVLLNVLRLVASPVLPQSWRKPFAQEALTEMRLGPAIAAATLTVALSTFVPGLVPWLG